MNKPKATKNQARNVETDVIRKGLIIRLGDLSYRIGLAQCEIKRQQAIIQGLGAEANGVGTQIEKLDGK